MERETEGVLQPADLCTKTRGRVMEVLRIKKPDAHSPTAASLDMYPYYPSEFIYVDIKNDPAMEVAGRLSRGVGPEETDSVSLQNWLLCFEAGIGELQLIFAYFAESLGNGRPPWTAYQTMMSGRMIALEK